MSRQQTYANTGSEVFAVALQSVRNLKYKINTIDEAGGLIIINIPIDWGFSSNHELAISTMDNGDGTHTIKIAEHQLLFGIPARPYRSGKLSSIADKIFKEMDRTLKLSSNL